jgi:hypothetical protein
MKGGASSHLRPCKVAYCDKHNTREDETPSNKNIRPEFSQKNTSWADPNVQNLVALDRQIRKDYFKNHGRNLPARGPSKASPIKESVTLMPNGSRQTDEIEKRIVARIERAFGIRCLRCFIHRDEYCEETGTFNWHCHEVWDMYDYSRHRIVQLSRKDLRKWQDIVAEETGMPRGIPSYETGRKWLAANDYKLEMLLEEIEKKEKEIMEKEEELERIGMDVEQEFMLKESLERHNAGLAAERKDSEKRIKELSIQSGREEDKIRLAGRISKPILEKLQSICNQYSSDPLQVEDFHITENRLECLSPTGEKSQLTKYSYDIIVTDAQNNHRRIVVNQDDFYQSSSKLKQKISLLFLKLPGITKDILKEIKPKKNVGPHL